MTKDRYEVWYTSPRGVPSPLEGFPAANDDEAKLVLGKVVRRRSSDLEVDGLVSLTNEAGEEIGSPSRVGEHLIPPRRAVREQGS